MAHDMAGGIYFKLLKAIFLSDGITIFKIIRYWKEIVKVIKSQESFCLVRIQPSKGMFPSYVSTSSLPWEM